MPSSWILADLTVESGAPGIGGNPYSNVISQNGQSIVQVVYNAGNNHIYELRQEPGQPWKVADLSAQSSAPMPSATLSSMPPLRMDRISRGLSTVL